MKNRHQSAVTEHDRASHRNRGGVIQQLITNYKLHRYVTKFGTGALIRSSAMFRITDGGILELGNNCTIQDYAYFQLTKPNPHVSVGDNSVIGRGCIITAKNRLVIGSNVLMGSYVQVTDHGHGISRSALIREQSALIGEVVVGNDVWIGVGAKILMNAHIGDGAVIGANAVVTSDIPSYAIAVGAPARVVGYRE